MHHSSEYMNVSTALRQDILELYAFAPFQLCLAIVLPPPVWVTYRLLNRLGQLWLHTEVGVEMYLQQY